MAENGTVVTCNGTARNCFEAYGDAKFDNNKNNTIHPIVNGSVTGKRYSIKHAATVNTGAGSAKTTFFPGTADGTCDSTAVFT